MKHDRVIPVVSTALLAGMLCFGCGNASSDATQIQLSADGVTVNGAAITESTDQAVYASTSVEIHEDVAADYKDTANTIIHITKAGDYEISGSMSDAQIRVSAPEQDVNLILNGVEIHNNTAPAIYIEDAADSKTAGEAGAVITLAEGTTNIINGSHVAKYIDENGVEIDSDGAISSNVSLMLDGTGELQVNGDKEGIETKMHLTINNGTIQIASSDDALNASEDGVSTITINDGIINCAIQNGTEGDGIDSNGSIHINGGFVVAQAHSSSMDSGLDADLGIFINGGTVCATGNMYEEISDESSQQHAQFYFAEKQSGNVPMVITDADGKYVLAYTPVNDFSILEFSSADLVDGQTYYLYRGGTLNGTVTNGIYTEVEIYTDGTQLAHRGIMTGRRLARPSVPGPEMPDSEPAEGFDPNNMPQRPDRQPGDAPEQPEGNQRPEPPQGFDPNNMPNNMPEGFEPGQMPENMPENFDPSQMPAGFPGGGGFDENAAQSIEFVVSADSRVYSGIAPYTASAATD